MKTTLLLFVVVAITQAIPQYPTSVGPLNYRLQFPKLPNGTTNWDPNLIEVFNSSSNPPPFPTPSTPSGPNPGNCECVLYYQCRHGMIIENGEGLIDPRMDRRCGSDNEVWCKRPDIALDATPPPPKVEVCGVSKNNDQWNRIVPARPDEAEFAEFPWMAAILYGQELTFLCGGSLVHPQVVLTAAHCVSDSMVLTVRLGEWDSGNTTEPQAHQNRSVIKIVQHPDYVMGLKHHDLALLFLDSPVTPAPNVGTICMAESTDSFDESSQCVVVGWNNNFYGVNQRSSAMLKKIEIPIVDRDTCEMYVRWRRPLIVFVGLHSSFMCASLNDCAGEFINNGGNPLMCRHRQHPHRYTLAGVFSWSAHFHFRHTPGIYASVRNGRAWINEVFIQNRALLKN